MAIAPNWKTLFAAIERDDKSAVKSLIADGIPANSINSKKETTAHIAVKKCNLSMLEYLLSEDGSLLTLQDDSGQNIFYLAVKKGAIEIVRYLVDNCKVDVFHKDNIRSGNSVVHLAAQEGHMDILKYFIEEKKFDPNMLNERGEPPAFLAAGNRKLPIIVYLHENHNADLRIVNHENRNILFPAAMKGDVTVPTYVLDDRKIQLDINWADKDGRTVLHWSALCNYLKITEYFVDLKHANVNAVDQMKKTPLHLAAEAGHMKLVEFLYECGADPQLQDINGTKPIELTKNKKVIKYLTNFPKVRQRRRRSPSPMKLPIFPQRLTHSTQASVPYAEVAQVRNFPAELLFSSRNQVVGSTYYLQSTDAAASNGFNNFLALANIYVGTKRVVHNDQSRLLSMTNNINNHKDPDVASIVRDLDSLLYP